METTTTLPHISRETLTRVVRESTNRPALEIRKWRGEAIHGGLGTTTGGIFRCSGIGRDHGQAVQWSIIYKLLRPPAVQNDASCWNYWKREAVVYESGLLEDLPPGGLAAPRCYGIEETPDGAVALWLEEIPQDDRWSMDRYRIAGRHLGQFNGAYLVSRPVPDHPWLSRDWLRNWVAQWHPQEAIEVVRSPETWRDPLLRQAYPVPIAADLLRLWEERQVFYRALERLPQTFCHLDAFRRNLIARSGPNGEEETVAIDWAFAGRGALGEEVGQLVWASLLLWEADLEEAAEIEEVAFEGYLEGLREAGWRGDPRLVRIGAMVAPLLRWGSILPGTIQTTLVPERHAAWEKRLERPFPEILAHWAAVGYRLMELAERARAALNAG